MICTVGELLPGQHNACNPQHTKINVCNYILPVLQICKVFCIGETPCSKFFFYLHFVNITFIRIILFRKEYDNIIKYRWCHKHIYAFQNFPVGRGGKKSCDLVFTPEMKHSKCTNTKKI